MANSTLPDNPPEEKNNPGQAEYEQLTRQFGNPDNKDNSPAGNPTDPRSNDVAAGDALVPGDTPSSDDLSTAEQNPDAGVPVHENQVGRGYRRGKPLSSPYSLGGYLNRRRAIFGGGMIGTIIALLMMLTFSSGPLQFIHIAQLEQKFHFSHQQDASNDRMGRLYRYMRSGGNAGETRLGWLGSKYHANMLTDLEKIGLKPVYKGAAGIYDGFEIDRSAKDSPFKDMSNKEVVATLEQKGVNAKEVRFNGAKVTVSVKGYLNQRKSLGFLTDEMGNSNIPQALRVRVMARYGLVTWHPMKKIDKKLNEKLSDLYNKWRAEREDRLKNGRFSGQLATSAAQEGEADSKTKPIASPGESGPLTEDHAKSLLTDIKNSRNLKVGGALATGVGLVCTVNSVYDNMGNLRYTQVITPLIRTGMDAITVGNQIMSGNDVSNTEMSFLSKNLTELNSKGKTVSTWNQSASIRANLGQTGGIDIDSPDKNQPSQLDLKDALSGDYPGWISWVKDFPAVNQLCSTAGSLITGAIGFTLSVFSGGIANTVGGAVASGLAGNFFIDKLSHFLSGESVNVAAAGAQWGNNVDYGSRLAANAMSLQFGGTQLSQNQSNELSAIQNAKSQAEFNSKNFAYKIFNPYDERSAISKVVDGSSSSFSQNINQTADAFISLGKNFGKIAGIFTPKTNAAPKPFDYGFSEYGFSLTDQDNSSVADPYANAEAVAAILDNSPNPFVQRAQDCFGVDIKPIPNPDSPSSHLWDVVPESAPANPYDPKYKNNNCADTSDPNWLKVRFFIMDTGVMEGYACYLGDNQSCQNDGFGDASSPATTSTAGSSADLTQVFADSTSIACADGTKDLGIQDGYHDNQVVKIRICAVSNLPSTSEESKDGYGVKGADGNVVVNSRVSGAVYAMVRAASKDSVPLIASSGFRTKQHQEALFNQNPDPNRVARPGYSNHQMGLAIDFVGLPSTPGPTKGNPIWDWLSKNAAQYGYKNYPQEAWHWSVTGN